MVDSRCYDAYLALGVENYLLGIKPAPVRWLLRAGGANTNRGEGLRELQVTAERGHFLKPFAKLLLAVAALRRHDDQNAKLILSELHREFPHNLLYERETRSPSNGKRGLNVVGFSSYSVYVRF